MEQQFTAFIWILLKIVLILVPLLVGVMYTVFLERKVAAAIQARLGPNRVGFLGLFQPIADMLKLLYKEIIVPARANKGLFVIAPMLTVAPAFAAWSVIPFNQDWVLANVNAGILLLFSVTSLGVYGILIAGWSSNSKYAMFGALRSAAQVVSYEIAMGFCFVGVILAAGSVNLSEIVLRQAGGIWHWYWLPLLPLFVVYWISALAETNRLPFDVAEGESEIVAGFHVEYSGMGFALFFLAEYANMILISAIITTLFLGGWLSPFQGIPGLENWFSWVPGIVWFLLKVVGFLFLYIWIRFTFPRYRYDQIMQLGWKVLIPITLIWILVEAVVIKV